MFGWELLESDDEVLADEASAVVDASTALAPFPLAWVVVVEEFENELKDPLPPLPAFETLVVDDRSADVVERAKDSDAAAIVVELELSPFPPFPPLPAFAALVVDDRSADVVEAARDSEAEVVELELSVALPPFPFWVADASAEEAVEVADEAFDDAEEVTSTSGPAATAEAGEVIVRRRQTVKCMLNSPARAAAASPLEPSLAATLVVVPDPMTVNLVQSSGVPR